MIPFGEEFEHLQARMLFGMNKFQILWELGTPYTLNISLLDGNSSGALFGAKITNEKTQQKIDMQWSTRDVERYYFWDAWYIMYLSYYSLTHFQI